MLCTGKPKRAILGYEGTVGVVDVSGALAVGEQRVEDHDGSAVHDEAHLAAEGAVKTLGEVRERLREQLARERNVVHVFQTEQREVVVDVLLALSDAAPTRAHARWTQRDPGITVDGVMAIRVRIERKYRAPLWSGG